MPEWVMDPLTGNRMQRGASPAQHARRAACRQACRVLFLIFRKIFLFSRTPNHIYHSCHPGPREGRIMIVTDVGCGMRWTRQR
jgi:hypothetical protein